MYDETLSRPLALVYKGPAADDGCPEALASLLENSPFDFRTKFVAKHGNGNNIKTLTPDLLAQATLYAQPGGPKDPPFNDYGPAFKKELEPYKKDIQDFVNNGGYYLGMCFGGYAAGSTVTSQDPDFPGFGLLADSIKTRREATQKGVHVHCSKPKCRDPGCVHDGIIRLDWISPSIRQTSKGQEQSPSVERWAYFQDGNCVLKSSQLGSDVEVLARYHDTQNIATMVCQYGKGVVGISGPHLEADKTWYDAVNPAFKNPYGYKLDLGYELVEAIMNRTDKVKKEQKVENGH